MARTDRRSRAAVLLGALALAACGGDWQPRADGGRQAMGWDPTALAGGARIVWQTNVGKGHSAVVVRGRYLYTMGSEQRGSGKHDWFDVVRCLDAFSGEVIWEYPYRCKKIYFPGPRATPVLDGPLLYTLSWQGHVFAFNAEDGTVVWSRDLVADSLARPGHWGLCGSPVVDGDLLLLTAGRSGLALDKKTGEVVWQSEPVATTMPRPVVFDAGGKRLVAVANEQTLYAADLQTGEVRWTFGWHQELHVPATVVDGKLFVPHPEKALLLDVGGGTPQVVMESTRAGLSKYQHYVVVDGHVYGFAGKFLVCLEVLTGKRKWKKRIGEHGALSAADGKLIILRGDGVLTIAQATPEGFREISDARVLELVSNRGLPPPEQNHCWTPPVLAGGRIYARSNYGDLVSVDVAL